MVRFEEIKQTELSLKTLQNKLTVVPRFKMSSLKLEICVCLRTRVGRHSPLKFRYGLEDFPNNNHAATITFALCTTKDVRIKSFFHRDTQRTVEDLNGPRNFLRHQNLWPPPRSGCVGPQRRSLFWERFEDGGRSGGFYAPRLYELPI